MKIGVLLDEDGHFIAVNIYHRSILAGELKKLQGGDYVSNFPDINFESFEHISFENYYKILEEMTQRGIFEIIAIQ